VIPRIGASVTFYGTAVVRQFETMEVYTLASSEAIGRSRDKLRSLQVLAREGIGLPVTAFARSVKDTGSIIDMVGGAPLILKLLEGTQGSGVVLTETKNAAESVIDAFRQLDANILVQEYIEEARGTDLRCIVVGGRVVAAMVRRAAEGDFRSNLHRGGTAEPAKLTTKERRTAVKAAKALGLNVAGVDLLRSDRGPLVLEVNSSPGLEGIEQATGVDVASEMIEFLENHADEIHR
jgi:ribosomal protein S6--L-glutamate ligase